MTLSVVIITNNSVRLVKLALDSIIGLWDELVVGDGGSRDGTVEMVKRYGGTVVNQRSDQPLGARKQELVEMAKGRWILILDADERVSEELKQEIRSLRASRIVAYRIPYQNYVFDRPVYYGGEKYEKVRLFKRGYASVTTDPLHEAVVVKKGTVGKLRGVIHHHSYRTPCQLFTKFTRYAWIAAGMHPAIRQGTLRKLFLYGPHMVWARYIKEKGYKDGWRGLVLAAAYGYMEGLTYWLIFIRHALAVLQEHVLQNHEVSVW